MEALPSSVVSRLLSISIDVDVLRAKTTFSLVFELHAEALEKLPDHGLDLVLLAQGAVVHGQI